MAADVGLLLLRTLVGALLLGHGAQKLLGWFGGPGLSGTTGFFRGLGYPAPGLFALLAATTEVGVGALFAAGLALPLAAAGLIGVMINAAVTVHAANGLWIQNGGYEYPLVLAGLGAALALTGPGQVSLAAVVGVEIAGIAGGIVAVAAGAVSALVALGLRRTGPATEPATA